MYIYSKQSFGRCQNDSCTTFFPILLISGDYIEIVNVKRCIVRLNDLFLFYFQVASGPVGAHGVNVVMIVNQEYNPNIGNQD
jgi:hypothetical protein